MKFLVIEGLDGSGKSTQLNLLRNYLDNNKIPFKYLHFPVTDSPVFGDLIARFLRGDLGKINEVNPYLVALIYAGDRNHAAEMLRQWQREGNLLVIDRYVFSNIAFQCAKLTDKQQRIDLAKWIFELEFSYYKIPQPDLSLFLDVPFDFTVQKLTSNRIGDDRSYLQGKEDIHEKDLSFQEKVRQIYLEQTTIYDHFKRVECADNEGSMLKPERIFERIIEQLKAHAIIK